MTRLIEDALSGLGVGMVRMHEGLSVKQRQQIIDQFNNDPYTRIFISTDAGSLGLNLQAADDGGMSDSATQTVLIQVASGQPHPCGAACATERAGQSGFKLTAATSFVVARRLFDIGKTALRAVFLLRSKSSFPPMCAGLKRGMM
jgi:hypothetical protein